MNTKVYNAILLIKENEQEKRERILVTEERTKTLDSKVRPFINALTEGQQAARKD